MMSSTEVLRRLLDECGVEYEVPHTGFTIVRTNNAVCKFYETLEEPERGVFAVVTTDWLAPEQAIAATLGNDGVGRTNDGVAERGTCHIVADRMTDCYWENKLEMECGATFLWAGENPAYCPYCGRKVVE